MVQFLKKYLIQIGLLTVILYQILFSWGPLWMEARQLQGMDVSHIKIVDEVGNQIPISYFKGKPLILNFWASWCLPCRAELPMLNGIYSNLIEKNKQLIGINQGDSWRTIINFREKTPIEFPVYKENGELSQKLNIRVIPALVVIDKTGKVESITYGFRPWVQAYLLWWV